jgi:hypothetical protein
MCCHCRACSVADGTPNSSNEMLVSCVSVLYDSTHMTNPTMTISAGLGRVPFGIISSGSFGKRPDGHTVYLQVEVILLSWRFHARQAHRETYIYINN